MMGRLRGTWELLEHWNWLAGNTSGRRYVQDAIPVRVTNIAEGEDTSATTHPYQ